MSYMETEYPGDVREAHVRTGRNISDLERWGSVAAGLSLAAYGLTRRRGRGFALAGVGALLLRRGLSGHCDTYELLGINTAGTGQDTPGLGTSPDPGQLTAARYRSEAG